MRKEDGKIGFSDLSRRDQILFVCIIALSLVVFVLAVLQLISIWEDSIKIYIPLLAVTMVLQAAYQWDKDKRMVWMYIGVAVFLAICSALILFVV
ncbi:MAG: hypothetical protein IJZ85_08560 [Lachnospiraceae bacterium]|nr:hypothetical protein [Lachnospiraceae bacterium]